MAQPIDQDRLRDRIALVDAHMDAERRHDVEAIMATFGKSPAFVLNDVALRARGDIQALYESFGFGGRGAFSDLKFDSSDRHVAADAIVLEGAISGRHTGDFQGIAPTHRTFEVPLCAIFTFDSSGMLAAERVYFDATVLLRQLGVLG